MNMVGDMGCGKRALTSPLLAKDARKMGHTAGADFASGEAVFAGDLSPRGFAAPD
jgi:hypothetical protein